MQTVEAVAPQRQRPQVPLQLARRKVDVQFDRCCRRCRLDFREKVVMLAVAVEVQVEVLNLVAPVLQHLLPPPQLDHQLQF